MLILLTIFIGLSILGAIPGAIVALKQISEAQKELRKVTGTICTLDPAPAPIRSKDLVALGRQHALTQSRVAFLA